MSAIPEKLQETARSLGIDALGAVAVHAIEPREAETFQTYLRLGFHADMDYLEKHGERRFDPTALLPGAQSLIACLFSYAQNPETPRNPHIARYAQGLDYHKIIKEKLLLLARSLSLPENSYRCFCDTAPLVEKYWAAKAGLGFIGRNSLLIHPRLGSFCFIGILLTDKKLDFSTEAEYEDFRPEGNNPQHPCRNCRRCIDACPGKALHEKAPCLEASRCNAYLTIENKDTRPNPNPSYWFGCDICQEVCPANRNIEIPQHSLFCPDPEILRLREEDFAAMSEAEFHTRFKNSPLLRAGLQGMRKNMEKTLSLQVKSKNNTKL